jgi:hypothetical protein
MDELCFRDGAVDRQFPVDETLPGAGDLAVHHYGEQQC